MSSIVRIAYNPVAAKIMDATKEVKLILSDLLSYQVEGFEFMASFQSKSWDGRSSFFQYGHAIFPAGFVHLVSVELQKRGYQVQYIRNPLPRPLGPENPIVDEHGNDNPDYDYQMHTVEQLLRHGMGIARVATGGGKSKIALLATARIRRTTLFLTTRQLLMYQMKGNYESAGFSCGVLGDGEWSPSSGVNVGMVQTFIAKLREPEPGDTSREADAQRLERARTIKLLELMEFVIGEEAHEAGGDSYDFILKHCRRAAYRLALTATPFMKVDAEDNMRLMAAFGPIIVEVSEKLLIDRGINATPCFRLNTTGAPPALRRSTAWPQCYTMGIVENDFRNKHTVFESLRSASYGLPVLILVQKKKHGHILEEQFRPTGRGAEFIFGETSQMKRKSALTRLGNGKLPILIGSTILDVGVDVPAIGHVINAGGGKAEVNLRQRIGRGARRKKSGPNVILFSDFTDDWNTYTRDHANMRRGILIDTPGFAERILPSGSDYDYARLGFTSKALKSA